MKISKTKKIIGLSLIIVFFFLSLREGVFLFKKDQMKIGKHHIDKNEYNKILNNTINYLAANGLEINDNNVPYIKQLALDLAVQDKIITDYIKKISLNVNDSTIVKIIKSLEQFSDKNEKFNKENLDTFLQKNKISEQEYVNQIKSSTLKQIIKHPLENISFKFNNVYKDIFNYYNDEFVTEVYTFDTEILRKNLNPITEDELLDFYKENKSNYEFPNYKVVKYLVLNKDAVDISDVSVSNQEIQEFIKENNYDKKYNIKYAKTESRAIAEDLSSAIKNNDIRKIRSISENKKIVFTKLTNIKTDDNKLENFVLKYITNFNYEDKHSPNVEVSFNEKDNLYYIFYKPNVINSNIDDNEYQKIKLLLMQSKTDYDLKMSALVNKIENSINRGEISFNEIQSLYSLKIYNVGKIDTDDYYSEDNKRLLKSDLFSYDEVMKQIIESKVQNINFFKKSQNREHTYYMIYVNDQIDSKPMTFHEAKKLIRKEIEMNKIKSKINNMVRKNSKNINKKRKGVKKEEIILSRKKILLNKDKNYDRYPDELLIETLQNGNVGEATQIYSDKKSSDKLVIGIIKSKNKKSIKKSNMDEIQNYHRKINTDLNDIAKKEFISALS